MTRLLVLLPVLLCFASPAAKAQPATVPADSAAATGPLQKAISLYHRAIGNQAGIYSGTEYVDYKYQTEGHPYFKSKHWGEGEVEYDGMLYSKVLMLYDIVNEAVVVAQLDHVESLSNKITIDLDRVEYFSLQGHHFVRLEQDSAAMTMPAGFYDLLYAGNTKVVAKRQKATKKEVGVLVYSEEDKFYIRRGGQYHQVKSKASVLKVFREHRKQLAKAMREHNISFKDNREQAIVWVAAHYDSLRH